MTAIQLDMISNLEGVRAVALAKAIKGWNGDRAEFERTLDATDAPRRVLKLMNAWLWGNDNPAATREEAGAQKGQKVVKQNENALPPFSKPTASRYRKFADVPWPNLVRWSQGYMDNGDTAPIMTAFEASQPYRRMVREKELDELSKPSFDHTDGAEWTPSMAEWTMLDAAVKLMQGGMDEAAAFDKAKGKAAKERQHWEAVQAAHDRKDDDGGPVVKCACREFTAHVEAASLDAVFTDPPYPQEFLPCWDELGAFAMHALKPGGVLLAMTGQQNLPEILDRLRDSGLAYRWTVAWVFHTENNGEPWPPAKVGVGWKPLVAFTKPGKAPARFSMDCFRSTPMTKAAKQEHEWGQNPETVRAVADQWLEPGWKVADPFCGAGAMLVAAQDMGCEISGCDIDEGHVQTTIAKLKKEKEANRA